MNATTDFARINEEFREEDRLRETNHKLELTISELQAKHRAELALLQRNLDKESSQLHIELANVADLKADIQMYQNQIRNSQKSLDNTTTRLIKARDLLIKTILRHSFKCTKMNAFCSLKQVLVPDDNRTITETREIMHEQIFSLQNQNNMLCKQIGKILRSVT